MVVSIAFNPDGLLASGLLDSNIIIWNVSTGTKLHTLQGHTNIVTSVAFNQDGLLASGSFDNTIRIWNVMSGTFFCYFICSGGSI